MKFLENFIGKTNKVNTEESEKAVEKQEEVKLTKNQYFFISSKNYTKYKDDFVPKNVNSIFFECSGHGSFQQKEVADRFLDYLYQTLLGIQNLLKIKIKIKLKITGFDMEKLGFSQNEIKKIKESDFFKRLSLILNQKITFVSSLELRIANMSNMQPTDLSTLLSIGINRQNLSDLTNLSFEFSNWLFAKQQYQNKSNQIQFDRFKEQMLKVISIGSTLPNLKKFRLQISTWYYDQKDYEQFFIPFYKVGEDKQSILMKDYRQKKMSGKKIETKEKAFHFEIYEMVKYLIQLMPNLMSLELDFRNWHNKFQMSQLKKFFENPDDLDLKNKMISPLSLLKKTVTVSKIQKVIQQSKIYKESMKGQQQQNINQRLPEEEQTQNKLQIHMVV